MIINIDTCHDCGGDLKGNHYHTVRNEEKEITGYRCPACANKELHRLLKRAQAKSSPGVTVEIDLYSELARKRYGLNEDDQQEIKKYFEQLEEQDKKR